MSGYRGDPQEFVSLARTGFLYQGQYFQWQHNGRGTPSLDLPASAFVAYLENHDQVANTDLGHRLAEICSPAELRAMTALLLLGPATPMLFQGQEYGSQRRSQRALVGTLQLPPQPPPSARTSATVA